MAVDRPALHPVLTANRDRIGAVTELRPLDGAALAEAMVVYHELLVDHREHLNRLNVYPVPDADTGTNLSLTLQAVVDSLPSGRSMAGVCAAMGRGSLMGARGASGVIMSQVLGAFAAHVAEAAHGDQARAVSALEFAGGLEDASAAADTAVLHPVEGTMLTVARDAAAAAVREAATGAALPEVLAAAWTAAGQALEQTPDLLPALRAAGVVDAGGTGFVLFLDALRHVVAGIPLPVPPVAAGAAVTPPTPETGPRYEVVVRLAVDEGVLADFRRVWDELGNESTVIVDGDEWWLAHIHTDHPEAAMEAARAAGAVRDVQVTDLVAQVRELEARWATDVVTAVVAIASGEGIQALFRELGAAAVVAGWPVRAPSVAEMLDAVESCGSRDVVVLPNDPNTVAAAYQLTGLTAAGVHVVPARTVVEGLAAMEAFDPAVDGALNAARMEAAAATVRPGAMTRAVQDATTEGGPVRTGEWIGIRPDAAPVIRATLGDGVRALIEDLMVGEASRITIVEGEGADPGAGAELAAWVHGRWPSVAVDIRTGGQPLYPYLVGVHPDGARE
jgi:DAK2 domain fusion protein YloV